MKKRTMPSPTSSTVELSKVAYDDAKDGIQQQQHIGIRCDECGECPIKGVRYKSRKIFNFDICEECRRENHKVKTDENDGGGDDDDDFVAFEIPTPAYKANQCGPSESNVINGISARDAKLQLARKGSSAHLAYFFPFYHPRMNHRIECQGLVNFMTHHTCLTNVHILFPNNAQILEWIIDGLAHNKSIRFLDLQLSRPSSAILSKVECFQKLIEGSTSNFETIGISTSQASISRLQPNLLGITLDEIDKFAFHLFQSLKKAKTIKTFRLDLNTPLSIERKKQAWETVMLNSTLKRFYADFQGDPNNNHLKTLTLFNRHDWKRRWVDVSATSNDRRLVLVEILKHSHLVGDEEVAWSIYHLLQTLPSVGRELIL